jgi:uncharacterized membrane protein
MAKEKKDSHMILAYFDTFEAAEAAAKELKGWDKASPDVKLGAIGVLHQTEKGKIKTKKYGPRSTGKGAAIGLILGILAAPFVAGASVAAGVVGGGVLGAFHKKSLGLKDEDLAKFKSEMDGGKAALVVMCDEIEVEPTQAKVDSLGGKTSIHEVVNVDLPKVAEEVQAPPPDEIVTAD